MDSELLTMPPVPGLDPEEERRKREAAALSGGMPPVPLKTPQPSLQPTAASAMPSVPLNPTPRSTAFPGVTSSGGAVKSYAPGSPEYNTALKETEPGMPPVQPTAPKPTPLTQPALPPVTGKAEMAAPAPGAQNTMPPVPVGPAQQRFEDLNKQGPPQPKWWQRALEIAGSVAPFGLAIEKQLPQTPIGYNAALNKAGMAAAKEQTIGKGQREATSEQANTREGREAYLKQNPDLADELSDFEKHDFLLTGKMPQKEPVQPKEPNLQQDYASAVADAQKRGVDPASDPKVQQTAEAIRALQKQPADKVDKKIDEFVDPKNNRINVMQRPDGTTYNVARGQSRSEAGVGSPSDVKDIADGIKGGIDPPDLSKYGYRDRTAIAAELKRQGFDLSTAAQDWTATQKHLATLNGAQQERLRQAVSFTSDSLGIIDDLYNQWQKVGPTSGWKVFNKASLATSKQLPGEAGNLAHRLDAQISDLTSELGTVYKGGNSSTDESLKLAAKNLEADWNEKTFKDAINQVRQNLEIRKNSIRHSQPAGVSGNSPYTPKSESETPKDFGDAGGKPEGTTGKLPDGTKVIVRGGKIVAQ